MVPDPSCSILPRTLPKALLRGVPAKPNEETPWKPQTSTKGSAKTSDADFVWHVLRVNPHVEWSDRTLRTEQLPGVATNGAIGRYERGSWPYY